MVFGLLSCFMPASTAENAVAGPSTPLRTTRPSCKFCYVTVENGFKIVYEVCNILLV